MIAEAVIGPGVIVVLARHVATAAGLVAHHVVIGLRGLLATVSHAARAGQLVIVPRGLLATVSHAVKAHLLVIVSHVVRAGQLVIARRAR